MQTHYFPGPGPDEMTDANKPDWSLNCILCDFRSVLLRKWQSQSVCKFDPQSVLRVPGRASNQSFALFQYWAHFESFHLRCWHQVWCMSSSGGPGAPGACLPRARADILNIPDMEEIVSDKLITRVKMAGCLEMLIRRPGLMGWCGGESDLWWNI